MIISPEATTSLTISLLLPEIIVVAMATWILVAGAFARGRNGWTLFAVAAFGVAGFALAQQEAQLGTNLALGGVSGPLASDHAAVFLRWLSLSAGALLALALGRLGPEEVATERIGLTMLASAGAMLVAGSGEMVLLFLGLELVSIPTYALLFLGRRDRAGGEAAMKYFFLSIVSSALLLYGLSLLYGVSGSTRLSLLAEAIAGSSMSALAPLGLLLVVAGLGFKIAAVPFHFYAPDVYQGTSNVNAGLLAVLPKIAGIAALLRVATAVAPALEQSGWQLALILALATMTLGNVCALWQKNIRRLLAYSSIAHSGYMLIGLTVALAAAGQTFGPAADLHRGLAGAGMGGMLLYLAVYSLASLGTFAALGWLSGPRGEIEGVGELAGLGRTRPLAAAALAVFMFSFMGIPLLAGFVGKLSLFSSAANMALHSTESGALWFWLLAIGGALNAAIGAAYYLRVVGVMYFQQPQAEPVPAAGGWGPQAAALACMVLVLFAGILPGPLWQQAQAAGLSARGWTEQMVLHTQTPPPTGGQPPADDPAAPPVDEPETSPEPVEEPPADPGATTPEPEGETSTEREPAPNPEANPESEPAVGDNPDLQP